MPRKLILGFVLAWGILSLLRETGRALADLDGRAGFRGDVAYWQLGTPPVERLDRCLDLVRRHVPPDRLVVFASSPDAGDAGPGSEFYRWRWAAYLLPRYDLALLQSPMPAETVRLAAYVLAYERTLEIPRLEVLAERPGCRLYRVRKGP
jgi:hypothetical protein